MPAMAMATTQHARSGSHLSHKTAQRDPATTPINSHQAHTHTHIVIYTHPHTHTLAALAISHVNEIVTLRATRVRFLSLLLSLSMTCVRLRLQGTGGWGRWWRLEMRLHCSRQLFIKMWRGFCGRGGDGRLTKCCAKELCPTRDRNSKKRVALRTCVLQLNAEIPCNDNKIYLQAVRTYCNLEARATDWECNTKSELYSPTAALLASIVDSYADSKIQYCT